MFRVRLIFKSFKRNPYTLFDAKSERAKRMREREREGEREGERERD